MGFYDTIGDIGQALSGIPAGLNAGLAPFNTWENIRKTDLANDASDITNRNAFLMQQGREGLDVPSFYGGAVQAVQTGNEATTAKNQLGAFGDQTSLAMQQYVTSPEGRARLEPLQPGSYDYNNELARIAIEHGNPYGPTAGAYATSLGPLEKAQMSQGVATQFLNRSLQSQYPGVTVTRTPYGYMAATPDGQEVNIPWSMQQTALAMEGNATPYNQFKDAATFQQALYTNQVNQAKTLAALNDPMQNDPMIKLDMERMKQKQDEIKAMTADMQKAMATAAYDPAAAAQVEVYRQQIAAAQQEAGAAYQRASQRAMGRGMGGGRGGMQVPPGGAAGMFQRTVSGPMQFGPQGVRAMPVRQGVQQGVQPGVQPAMPNYMQDLGTPMPMPQTQVIANPQLYGNGGYSIGLPGNPLFTLPMQQRTPGDYYVPQFQD